MSYEYPDKVTFYKSSVGTTAVEIVPGGAGQCIVVVTNDDGVDDLYVGWDSSVSATTGTHFTGGLLAPAGTITLNPWRGPIWLEGEAAGVDYRVEVRSVTRTA